MKVICWADLVGPNQAWWAHNLRFFRSSSDRLGLLNLS